MPTPRPHQIEGARFLASREAGLLADDPRVGKTGASVMACDFVLARKILVVTTATGRVNFGREFEAWQAFPRRVQVLVRASDPIDPDTEVLVVGWPALINRELFPVLKAWGAEVLVLDESHYAKNPAAARTRAAWSLADGTKRVMCLSGTPMPNAPNDLWPMLDALAPDRISYMGYDAFVARYCEVKARYISGRRIETVVGGKNLDELRGRLDGFWLRRTQQDVGIGEPIYSTLSVYGKVPKEYRSVDMDIVLAAAEAGDTGTLDMHLGPVRRLTGMLKAEAVAEFVEEEMLNGLDRVVLMCWHTAVVDYLADRLNPMGVAVVDGRTPAGRRQSEVDRFQAGEAKVFVGQILAAGEAIDLSASCNLIFVEASWTPKDMRQAALRITNHQQKRQCLVRFAALAGSIDEALTGVLTRKVATIRKVLGS